MPYTHKDIHQCVIYEDGRRKISKWKVMYLNPEHKIMYRLYKTNPNNKNIIQSMKKHSKYEKHYSKYEKNETCTYK